MIRVKGCLILKHVLFRKPSAANPCKEAWSVNNSNRNKTTAYMCPASPDELNQYFIHAVNSIVADMPDGSDETAGKVVGDSRLTWSNWKRTSPDEVVVLSLGSRFPEG